MMIKLLKSISSMKIVVLMRKRNYLMLRTSKSLHNLMMEITMEMEIIALLIKIYHKIA